MEADNEDTICCSSNTASSDGQGLSTDIILDTPIEMSAQVGQH